MTGHQDRLLLFLDVDGPLLPFGDGSRGERSGTGPTAHLARLAPHVGPRLAALPCDLVWATTWEAEANALIAPRIGLPRLPVVNWPDPSDEHEREDQWFGLCRKTRTVVAWANQRPFAWVDDEITDADRDWAATHHPPRLGLPGPRRLPQSGGRHRNRPVPPVPRDPVILKWARLDEHFLAPVPAGPSWKQSPLSPVHKAGDGIPRPDASPAPGNR